MTEAPPPFYCHLERMEVPREEFEYTRGWGWVHTHSEYEPHTMYGTFLSETCTMEDLIL